MPTRLPVKTIFITLLLLLSFSAMAQSPWTQSREMTIPAPAPTAGVQQINLQLVLDETSEWARPGEIESQITKSSNIFRKCGVELGSVQIRYVRYSQATVTALNNQNPYRGPSELILTQGELSRTRPTVFLFGNQIPETAKAFSDTSIARLSAGAPVDVKPLKYMSVISGGYRTNDSVPGCHASYSNLAHELAHILGDLDHIDEANNLMSSRRAPNSKSANLNPAQCEKIRTVSLTNFSGLKSQEEDCP